MTQVSVHDGGNGLVNAGPEDGRAQAPVLQRGGSLIHDDSASCGGLLLLLLTRRPELS